MAKLTTRDHVWAAALEAAEENATGSAWSRRFGAEDVANRMADPPSSKTIRETLQSMAELGAIQKGRSQGQYEVSEAFRELLEGDAAKLQEQLDELLEGVAALLDEGDVGIVVETYRGSEEREPDVEALRELLVGSHYQVGRDVSLELPGAEPDQEVEELREERDRLQGRIANLEDDFVPLEQERDELQERADELQGKVSSLEKRHVRERQPAESVPLAELKPRSQVEVEQEAEFEEEQEIDMEPEPEFDTVEQLVGDAPAVDVSTLGVPPAVSNTIADLDLPGEGDVLIDRINLVSNVVAWIRRHGEAGRSELRENVVDPDPAGYADGYSAWKNLVQPALQDLDEVLDELESPGEGGQAWRWDG